MKKKTDEGKACETAREKKPVLSVVFLFAAILILTIACRPIPFKGNDTDKITVSRIEYFYRLKSLLGKVTWEGFDHPAFELPLIYYTESHCYVVNPTKKFLSIYRPSLIHKKGRIKIYKTNLIDSTAFHMETFFSLEDTAAYDYKSMFMRCSSFEVTKLQPQAEVLDVERWATLVLHEYFHSFQFTHPGFSAYHRDSIIGVPGAALKRVYDDNPGIKESIDRENDLLLKALETENLKEATALIDSFFVIRTNRQEMVKRSSGFDIGKYEEFYETTEGTARYIEYGLSGIFKNKELDRKLARLDTAYHSYQYFRTSKLQDEPSMYLTSKTNYVYAIGFNMARLADKFRLPYKTRLFKEPQLSLEQILRSFVDDNRGR